MNSDLNYRTYADFELDVVSLHELNTINWKKLPVTTELNRWQVFQDFINHYKLRGWKLKNFINRYGIIGQQVCILKNIRLPAELDQRIKKQVNNFFNAAQDPVVRLQVIFNGTIVPLHKDTTRESSFIIPIMNHAGSFTKFYNYNNTQIGDGLVDPGACTCVDQVEIVCPTLINTKKIHSVEFANQYTINNPRISITAKWESCNFQELVS
jgi:hypothetical protein